MLRFVHLDKLQYLQEIKGMILKKRTIYWTGSLASIIYITAIILGGLMWPGYSHVRQAISELIMLTAPNRSVMLAFFTLYNLLVLIFAVGVFSQKENRLIKTSAVALLLVAISGIMMNVFPQDPINTVLTFHGLVHLIFAGIAAVSTILAIFTGGIGLAQYVGNKNFKYLSIVLGTIVVISGGFTPIAATKFSAYFGLFERVTILSFIVWLFMFSSILWKHDKLR